MPQPFSILDAIIAAGFRSVGGKLEVNVPVTVSRRTIDAVFGFGFEYGAELVTKWGRAVRQVGAGKRVIMVADLLYAIEAESAQRAATQVPLSEAEEAAERLRMRGYQVRQ